VFDEHTFSTTLGDQEITFSTGKIARLAGGAVIAKSGETVLLATATMSDPREGISFFPLTVNFEERLYAAGRIPGSFFRREGRPSEKAILTSRLIDRPLRPLFPKDMRNDVQIILTPLSQGEEEHADILGVIAASAALMISDIPFDGPVAAVRIGYVDGELIANPTISQMEESTLDLRVAGGEDAIIMVEAGADEVDEALMIDAIELAHESFQDAIQMQKEMREAIGKSKRDDYPRFGTPDAVVEKVEAIATDRLRDLLRETQLKEDRDAALSQAEEDVKAELAEEAEANGWDEGDIHDAFESAVKKVVRERILSDDVRPDGRDQRTIRALDAEVGLMPRPHGTGLFTRGETQVLSLATLGMPGEEQTLDDLFPEETKRYIHHYNFPPFSTGETWFLRGPRRREIGHGALAERALEPVLPTQEEFPYTIRVVSEVMSSNGSTSMASVCGSTLSLMDAGVPIKSPVGGIAMGLVSDGERYRVLTDIQGMEDHLGDMDFKVTGTRQGVTALQMDIKIKGVTRAILTEALEQAKEARLQILDVIEGTIPEPREELSTYAPKMLTIKIDPEMIGLIIGPGGKHIRATQEEYDVQIDVEEDGTVFVAAESGSGAQEAIEYIRTITTPPEEGKIYTGRVVRITDFGAFVEILPGTDGLVHISQLSDEHVRSVEDVVNVGDEVLVMVTNVGRDNKIRLSRKAVINGWTLEEAREDDQPKRSSRKRRSPRRR
jgi:polyribonucleotide nucleotidyltransferase